MINRFERFQFQSLRFYRRWFTRINNLISENKYWAFVSYSSKDEKWAKKLHNFLETYSIPKDLLGRPGVDGKPIPKHIFPASKDRDELSLSSDIGNSIETALDASKYLIIICSPHAVASQWVNEEIIKELRDMMKEGMSLS